MCHPIIRILFSGLLLAGLAACSQEPHAGNAAPRPVKVEQIGTSEGLAAESFVGTVRAHRHADLGFESGGRIAAILVEVGDSVQMGQPLARLDPATAQAHLAKASADQTAASMTLKEREAQLHRTLQLEHDQVVAHAAVEDAQTQQQAALSQLQAAKAAVALAQREVNLGEIRAPFSGQIVARQAQPFADVAPAQVILQLEATGALEVVLPLPERTASTLKLGQAAQIQLSGSTTVIPATLDKLSGRADNGAQVQAIFRIDGTAPDLRSGSTVAVTLAASGTVALTIPAAALLPGQQPGSGHVFVLDMARQKLQLRSVQVGSTLAANGRIPLLSGVQRGEWVVVTGTPFLIDGQAATRFVPQTLLKDTQS